MVFEVYCDPCTVNSRKVMAGLDLIGTKFHFNHVDYFKGEHRTDEYAKINPCKTVPAAVDGHAPLTESNAILMYAADRDGGSPAYPKDLQQRAQVNRWLLWESSVWFHSCYTFLIENVAKRSMGGQPDQAVLEKETENWHKLAKILDDQFAKHKWLCGDEVTIADIAVAAPMHLSPHQGLPIDEHPNLKRWYYEDIKNLPAWKNSQGPVDAMVQGASERREAAAGNGS